VADREQQTLRLLAISSRSGALPMLYSAVNFLEKPALWRII
jgi:hypothetical protein